MRALVSWRKLPAERRSLLPRALLAVIGVRVGLLALPFASLRGLLSHARRRTVDRPGDFTERDVVWSVSRASTIVPGATCLTQALATELLLARRGLAPSVQIGVRRSDPGTLEAHAWVEVDGRIVACGRGAEQYVELRSINGRPADVVARDTRRTSGS